MQQSVNTQQLLDATNKGLLKSLAFSERLDVDVPTVVTPHGYYSANKDLTYKDQKKAKPPFTIGYVIDSLGPPFLGAIPSLGMVYSAALGGYAAAVTIEGVAKKQVYNTTVSSVDPLTASVRVYVLLDQTKRIPTTNVA